MKAQRQPMGFGTLLRTAILCMLVPLALTACGTTAPAASLPAPSPTSSPPTSTPTPTPTPDLTANFKPFADSFGHVSLQYPPEWTLDVTEKADRVQITIVSDHEGVVKAMEEEDYSSPVGFFRGEVGLELDFISASARLSEDPERILDDVMENILAPFKPVGERSIGERDGMRLASQKFEASNVSGTLQGTITVVVNGMRMGLFFSGATLAGADEYLPLVQATMDSVVVYPWLPEVQVDLSTPEGALEVVFEAARTGDFAALAGLCDPLGENDRDTQRICDLAGAPDGFLRSSFVEYFSSGKLNGEAVISADGNTAEVPFLFGPNGDQEETMRLIKRGGNWYLLDY